MERKGAQREIRIYFRELSVQILPDISRAGITIAVTNQKAKHKFMRSRTDRIQVTGGEVVGITQVHTVPQVHSYHGRIAILQAVTATQPEQIAVLDFEVHIQLRTQRNGGYIFHHDGGKYIHIFIAGKPVTHSSEQVGHQL